MGFSDLFCGIGGMVAGYLINSKFSVQIEKFKTQIKSFIDGFKKGSGDGKNS